MKYHDFKLIVMAALLGLASCHRQSRDVTTWTETTSKQRVNLFNLLDESSVTNSKVAPGPGRPLTFDLNKGQFGKDVDFVHAGPEAKFKLSKGKASIITRRQAPATGMGLFALAPESTEGFNVLGISFAGSNPSPSPLGLEPLPTKTNYYVGNDTSKWASGVATFQKVLYQNLYTGIDLAIYGTSTQVKYDLIVKPGADPAMIRLSFDGVVNVTKLENGDLLLLFADGRTVTHKAPVAYQGNNKESSVDSSYVLHPDDSITFAVGAYDSTKPLIIDPLIDFSTYYGQGQVTIQDPFYGDIVAGTDGMIFFTGSASTGGSGIQLVNPIDGDLTGDIDIYIAKIDTKTNTIVFSTYIGSPDREDRGNAMILDSDENIFVAGSTDSRQFTMGGDPMNPWQPQITGDVDTFVVKLTKDGLFVTSTYLGGSADDVANSLTLSSSGQIILGGFTNSQDFPLPDGGCCAYAPVQDNDAFVYSLSPDLTQLNFTKLLQGSGTERTLGLASDANGHI